MTIAELQRIKQWHLAHGHDHPVECQLWDAMLTLWLMGWVGWLPAWALGAWWAALLCIAAILAPSAYVACRSLAHRARRLRCDWLPR